jgi:hypothetical protein
VDKGFTSLIVSESKDDIELLRTEPSSSEELSPSILADILKALDIISKDIGIFF